MSIPNSARSMAVFIALLVADPAFGQEVSDAGDVRLSLERYEALMGRADGMGGGPAAWNNATLRVELPDEAGQSATAMFAGRVVPAVGSTSVPVLPADVALVEASVGGAEASFHVSGGVLRLADLAPGVQHFVSLRYRVQTTRSLEGARGALIPIPPVPGTTLTLIAPEGGDVEVWPALDIERSGSESTAQVPATAGIFVRWGGGLGSDAVRRVGLALEPDPTGDGLEVEATLEVRSSGVRAEVRVAPATAALLDVREGTEALAVRVQDDGQYAMVQGAGKHTIKARYRLAIDRSQGQPQVTLDLDRAPITHLELTVAGKRDVLLDPPSPIAITVIGDGDSARTRAVADLPPTEAVTVRWTESRAAPEDLTKVNTETYQLVRLQEAVLRSRAVIRYEVIRGKVQELAVELPEGVVLFKVTGAKVDDWRTFAPTDDAPRQARIFLAEPQTGTYTLELELEQVVPTTEGADLVVPVVRPLGTFREMGVIALFDGDKVGFAPAVAEGYTKVGEDALPVELRQGLTDKVSQAVKHIGAPGPMTSKVATAKAKDVRFDAHVHTLYHFKEGSLIGQASILVETKSGRRSELDLSLPEGVTVLSLTAPSLNKHETVRDAPAEQGRVLHRVSFTRALEGAVQLDLEIEMLLPKELGLLALPAVHVAGADVEDGAFGITAETGIEVRPAGESDVRAVGTSDLPRAVRLRSEREILLGFAYARAPWKLELQVVRLETVETLEAVVRHAWVETTVLEEGHLVTHASFDVDNTDRQFLRLVLPDGHQVWTVAAGGVAVKAVADGEGALAVPLPKGSEARIDVVFVVRREELGWFGAIELMVPKADLLVTDVQWLLRSPSRLSLYGMRSRLEERDPDAFHMAYSRTEGLRTPFELPTDGSYREQLFTYTVLDPEEEPLVLAFNYVATPGQGTGVVLYVLALLFGLYFVRRVAKGRGVGSTGWAALALAALFVGARWIGWGMGPVEGGIFFGLVVVVAVVTRIRRRKDEEFVT
jgi:hypothetical protein